MKKILLVCYLIALSFPLISAKVTPGNDSAEQKKLMTFMKEMYSQWQKSSDQKLLDSTDKTSLLVVSAGAVTSTKHDTPVITGEYIYVEVNRIRDFLAKQQDYMKENPNDSSSQIILYINGLPMYDIPVFTKNITKNRFIFKLDRHSHSLQQMNPYISYLWTKVHLSFSVGFKNGESLKTAATYKGTPLRYISMLAFVLTLFLVAFIVGVFIYLAKKTDLIRIGDNNSPFSLGLTQLCFWTVVIASSYFYIWIVTEELIPISSKTLILLGISMATTAGSKLIDFKKKDTDFIQARSGGFFSDISSDSIGYSVHRVQMILWTAILGIIFIKKVVSEQQMPELDDSLLALMGISSAGFVGLKTMENTADPDAEKAETPEGDGKQQT
ncbi:MAG: hypothetical protein NTU98_12600 [Bacteroidetes bacterium]|nr:hypothetical protein [Bacteroidota bacterium]